MKHLARLASALALCIAVAQPSPAATIQDVAGVYEGTWNNTTFGSQGAAHMTFVVRDPNIAVYIDMDGNVLGGADPPQVVLFGTLSGGNASFDQTVATYGHVVASIQGSDGSFSGNLDMISAYILSANATGTVANGALALDYSVMVLGAGTAVGTISATRVPEPVGAACTAAVLAARATLRKRRAVSGMPRLPVGLYWGP